MKRTFQPKKDKQKKSMVFSKECQQELEERY